MFRRQAYYYASAAFLVMLIVYSAVIIKQPYVGVELDSVEGNWIVTHSDPQGEGYKSGIRAGDLILKINYDDPGETRHVKIWSAAEGASTLEVRRINQPNSRIINIPDIPFLQSILREVPFAILGFVFWLLGFMTWLRRPFLGQARALFWVNWFVGLAIVLAPASSRDLLFARELEYIFFGAVPIFLISFISIFPIKNINRLNSLGRLILILLFVIVFIVTIMQSAGIIHSFNLLRKLVLTTVSIGVFFALWNLVTLFKLPKDKQENNQASFLLMGMSIGFLPFVLLTAIPIVFGLQPIMSAHASSLFVSFIPMTLYYVVVNKYLPDSRRILVTIMSYFVAGVIISFIISYLFALKLSSTFNLELYLKTLALLVVFIISFNLIRIVISKPLNKHLFPEGNQVFKRRILELHESLSMINEENLMLEEVVKSLAIEGVFIAVEDAKGGYQKKAVGSFLESEQSELVEFFQADQRINLEAKILPESFPAEIYIPIVSNDYSCGLFIGHRYSRVKFELDELPLIMLISSQLAQRLITTVVVKELSKEMEELAQRSLDSQRRNKRLHGITGSLFKNIEQERKSIARDLHDGSLQLALDLNRRLDDIAEECACAKGDKALKAIAHMREVVANLNFELRSICSDLRPPSLNDLGLLYAIQIMCEEKMENESLFISLETVGISEGVRLKEEVELAAYRFLQEGITNAVKHSGSSKINISIELNDSELELSIRDFGNGFDIGKIDDWPLTREHFGLIGMKERFQGIGGKLQINSIIHQGTIMKASIPR